MFWFILFRQTNPEHLCSNLSTVRTINPKSILWDSLLSILAHPYSKSDLASAIKTGFDLKRMRASDYTKIIYFLNPYNLNKAIVSFFLVNQFLE